jgi:hypothetical protein
VDVAGQVVDGGVVETALGDEILCAGPGGQPHVVSGALQAQAEGHIGLDVAARADGDDGDAHVWLL